MEHATLFQFEELVCTIVALVTMERNEGQAGWVYCWLGNSGSYTVCPAYAQPNVHQIDPAALVSTHENVRMTVVEGEYRT